MPARWLAGSTIVASARYLGALHLRIEALTQSDDNARQLLETVKTFFALIKSADLSTTQGGSDADVKAFFDSLKVEAHGKPSGLDGEHPPGIHPQGARTRPQPAAGHILPPLRRERPARPARGRSHSEKIRAAISAALYPQT